MLYKPKKLQVQTIFKILRQVYIINPYFQWLNENRPPVTMVTSKSDRHNLHHSLGVVLPLYDCNFDSIRKPNFLSAI